MPVGHQPSARRPWRALLPALLSLCLLYPAAGSGRLIPWLALAGSAAVLLLGLRWLRTTGPGRIAGAYLGFATAFMAVLRAFGFSADFWWVALPAVFIAVLGVLYDLFVWQPHKGRFARARAERRGWPEQE